MSGRPELPQIEPQEARRTAEDAAHQGAPQTAIAWGLLAVAGELHAIRRQLERPPRR